MKLLIIFIVCNIINVIIQTVKSLVTIKCKKTMASIINALAYGFYTYIVILMVCELPMIWKCIIVGLCNLVGVWVVKFIEEKMQKDKLWKIEFTCKTLDLAEIDGVLKNQNIPHNYITIGKHTIFNTYAENQEQSIKIKKIVELFNCKYFATETKIL